MERKRGHLEITRNMKDLTLEEKAWIRVVHGVLISSETIEENNARLVAMRSSDEDKQRTKAIATTIIVAFIITAAVAISYWLSQVS